MLSAQGTLIGYRRYRYIPKEAVVYDLYLLGIAEVLAPLDLRCIIWMRYYLAFSMDCVSERFHLLAPAIPGFSYPGWPFIRRRQQISIHCPKASFSPTKSIDLRTLRALMPVTFSASDRVYVVMMAAVMLPIAVWHSVVFRWYFERAIATVWEIVGGNMDGCLSVRLKL